MAILHCYWHLVVQEWEFHTAAGSLRSRMAISHCYWYRGVKNGNFTLLITSSGWWWQFHIATKSSGQEWQFHIATDIHSSRMAIITLILTSSGQEWQFHSCCWHVVVNNGNFTFATGNHWSRMAISHSYWQLAVIKNSNLTVAIDI